MREHLDRDPGLFLCVRASRQCLSFRDAASHIYAGPRYNGSADGDNGGNVDAVANEVSFDRADRHSHLFKPQDSCAGSDDIASPHTYDPASAELYSNRYADACPSCRFARPRHG